MKPTKAKYQMFPALAPGQYKLLEDDIKARGVMVPVEVDEQGNILDGHHRVEIADKHKKTYETIVRRFDTEEQKREHIVKLNLARRQMADHAWGLAFKKLCESRGVRTGRGGPGRGQGSKPKQSKANVALDSTSDNTIASLAKEVGVSERTAKRRLKTAREYETYDDQIRDGLDAGKVTAAQVRKEHVEPEPKVREAATVGKASLAKAATEREPVTRTVTCTRCGDMHECNR